MLVFLPRATSIYIYKTHNKTRMMTSSNGNIYCVTGPLWAEFIYHRGIPSQRPVAWSFNVFFYVRLENGWANNGNAAVVVFMMTSLYRNGWTFHLSLSHWLKNYIEMKASSHRITRFLHFIRKLFVLRLLNLWHRQFGTIEVILKRSFCTVKIGYMVDCCLFVA